MSLVYVCAICTQMCKNLCKSIHSLFIKWLRSYQIFLAFPYFSAAIFPLDNCGFFKVSTCTSNHRHVIVLKIQSLCEDHFSTSTPTFDYEPRPVFQNVNSTDTSSMVWTFSSISVVMRHDYVTLMKNQILSAQKALKYIDYVSRTFLLPVPVTFSPDHDPPHLAACPEGICPIHFFHQQSSFSIFVPQSSAKEQIEWFFNHQ